MADGLAPRVEPCTLQTLDEWVALRHALWPDGSEQDHRADAQALLWEQKEAIALLVRLGNGTAAGFAEAALRRDYVNGCSTSPVGFLEGIYVKPEYRGIAALPGCCAGRSRIGREASAAGNSPPTSSSTTQVRRTCTGPSVSRRRSGWCITASRWRLAEPFPSPLRGGMKGGGRKVRAQRVIQRA